MTARRRPTATQRGAAGALLLILTGIGLGGRPDRAEWQAGLAAMRAEHLIGLWVVDFHLDRPVGDTLPRRTASGQIALTLNEQRLSGPGFDSPPVYFGTYDISFEPLRPGTVFQGGVPTVVAMLRGVDTLDLRIAPELPQGFELSGILQGDSVVGRWKARPPRGIDAVGDFVLRRR